MYVYSPLAFTYINSSGEMDFLKVHGVGTSILIIVLNY